MRVQWLGAALVAGSLAVSVAWSPAASAQSSPPATAQADAEADIALTQDELRTLLKPIALYPDVLLAQMLPASAYPLEIVQAARWLERNKAAAGKGDFSGVDGMN